MNIEQLLENIPHPPDCEPLPFQLAGAREIVIRPHVLLADDMGLGKTVQIILAANVVKPMLVLVVCPRAVLLSWKHHWETWCTYIDELKSVSQEIEDGQGPAWIEVATTDLYLGLSPITIINYEALVRWLPAIAQRKYEWIVMDECHVIKTPHAQRSVATRAAALRADKVIGVTGSPILNYAYELAPVIQPILHNYPNIENIWKYNPAVHLKDHKGNDYITNDWYLHRYTYGKGNKFTRHTDELQTKLRETIMIRRTKAEVLPELPRKRRQVIEMKLEETDVETRKLLDEEKKIFEGRGRTLDSILEEIVQDAAVAGVNASEIAETEVDWNTLVESMKYTKQYFFEEMARLRHLTALAKVPYAMEHIKDVLSNMNGDAKLVIFAHHHDVMTQLQREIIELGYSCEVVSGRENSDIYDRQDVIDRFQKGDLQVFIGGIKAVGVGITLTRASHCIFIECDWSPPIITQAEDRLHRIGTHAPVLIQHFTLEDSLDTHIAKTVMRKQKQIEKVLNRPKEV